MTQANEAALDAVVRNKGAPGIDGITVKQLPSILKARWPEIEEQLLKGRYQPQPVRRVEIPKPDRRDAQARHSDVGGIKHLMQLTFGMMEEDGPSWRPIVGGVDPIRH